ncbi:MAG TPA: DUF354 domain-containing protein, partial [Thermodesulfobacteriota bacterium]|nr:DUF354 domain-containing protein [Thermodesulfobacteriota bacterium]
MTLKRRRIDRTHPGILLSLRSVFPPCLHKEKAFQIKVLSQPPSVVEGVNLIWQSDLVISGGGTMNREAAALGVPVYSIFR